MDSVRSWPYGAIFRPDNFVFKTACLHDRVKSSHWLNKQFFEDFEAHPPLEFKAPPEKRKHPPYTGMAKFVSNFAEKGDPEYQPPVMKGETQAQKKAKIHKLCLEEGERKVAEELEKYDPQHNPDATGDPYKTLFVSRLNYETSKSKIKREFAAYGTIKRRISRRIKV